MLDQIKVAFKKKFMSTFFMQTIVVNAKSLKIKF